MEKDLEEERKIRTKEKKDLEGRKSELRSKLDQAYAQLSVADKATEDLNSLRKEIISLQTQVKI